MGGTCAELPPFAPPIEDSTILAIHERQRKLGRISGIELLANFVLSGIEVGFNLIQKNIKILSYAR